MDQSGTRISISRDDVEAVRTLRAFAYLESTGNWILIDRGAELQRLAIRQVDEWAREIEEQLALHRLDPMSVDTEVGYLTNALILSSQMLGIESSFSPGSAVKKINSVFAPTPESNPQLLPAQLRKFREFAVRESGQSGRESLQNLVLRRTSYTQGGGMDAGVDTERILRSHRAYTKSPMVPKSVPIGVIGFVDRLNATMEDLDSIRVAIDGVLPDTTAIDNNVKETVKSVEKSLRMLQTVGMIPGRVDLPAIARLGDLLESNDVQRVVKVREQLSAWDTLTTVEKLQALSGEWPGSVTRLEPWIVAVTSALDSIESHINTKIDPKLQSAAITIDAELETALGKAVGVLSTILESEQES